MTSKLIIVSGPTASGKTGTSIKLAKFIQDQFHQDVAIVNFDSLLFYKEISIGTAKPTINERENISHYMIDIESINAPLNASDYIDQANKTISELHQKNIIPILVGGSAFYLRALLKGMYESPKSSEEIKTLVEKQYKENGIEPIIQFLKINDPEVLEYLHKNDHYRLTRAYEHFLSNGTKISEQKKESDNNDPYDFHKLKVPWEICHFYLDLPKNIHFEIIQKRTQKMFQDGLLEEVDNLLKNGYSTELKPLNSIGYKETIEFLQGKYLTKEECIERICISTRQLAKSQRTFFKKIRPKHEINSLNEFDKILEITKQFLADDK